MSIKKRDVEGDTSRFRLINLTVYNGFWQRPERRVTLRPPGAGCKNVSILGGMTDLRSVADPVPTSWRRDVSLFFSLLTRFQVSYWRALARFFLMIKKYANLNLVSTYTYG